MKRGEQFSPYRRFYDLQIPLSIASHQELSDLAKLLYGALAYHAGKDTTTFVGITVLARELACSDDKVQRGFRELTAQGLIARRQVGNGRRAVTTLLWSDLLTPSLRKSDAASAELRGLDLPPASADMWQQQPQNCRSAPADLRQPYKEEENQEEIQEETHPSDLQVAGRKTRDSQPANETFASAADAKAAAKTVDIADYAQSDPKTRLQAPRQRWNQTAVNLITSTVTEYLAGSGKPPDRIMAMKILDHGWGAGALEVCNYVDSIKAKHPSGSPTGRRESIWWFVNVVSEHFLREHQRETSTAPTKCSGGGLTRASSIVPDLDKAPF